MTKSDAAFFQELPPMLYPYALNEDGAYPSGMFGVECDGKSYLMTEHDYAVCVERGVAKPLEYRTFIITGISEPKDSP